MAVAFLTLVRKPGIHAGGVLWDVYVYGLQPHHRIAKLVPVITVLERLSEINTASSLTVVTGRGRARSYLHMNASYSIWHLAWKFVDRKYTV